MPWVVPIIHPAAILRGRWADSDPQVAYLRRVAEFLRGEFTPHPIEDEVPPPGGRLLPQLAHLAEFDRLAQSLDWDALSIDLENAGQYITLVGLTLFNVHSGVIGPSLSLPWRVRFGHRYWQHRADHDRAVEYLGRWLADPRTIKVFHNGVVHDVPLLENHGFEVAGELWDTMVMQHYCYPELRKGLQYCSTLYFGSSVWKTLVDEEDEDEGKA